VSAFKSPDAKVVVERVNATYKARSLWTDTAKQVREFFRGDHALTLSAPVGTITCRVGAVGHPEGDLCGAYAEAE
jgi:hypothetical protein